MTKRIICLLLALLLVVPVALAAPMSQSEVDQGIRDAEDEQEALIQEQRQLTQEIDAILLKLDGLEADLAQTQSDIDTAEASVAELETEIKALNDKIAERQGLLDLRIRAMYKSGDLTMLSYLFQTDSLADFWNRLVYLNRIAHNDKTLIEEQKRDQQAVVDKKEKLDTTLANLETMRQTLKDDIAESKALKAEKDEKLKKVLDQQEENERQLSELQAVSDQLAEELRRMQEAANAATQKPADATATPGADTDAPATPTNQPTATPKPTSKPSSQSMIWPVPGFTRITSYFGTRKHPITGQIKTHTGIDIGSNWANNQSIYGANFVAAKDGTVIKASPYPSLTSGYGNCVIIDHGNGITTLYGHGSAILVSVGQQVKQGQPVLRVGSTGASTGAHAHFEVRKNGSPVDPLGYVSP